MTLTSVIRRADFSDENWNALVKAGVVAGWERNGAKIDWTGPPTRGIGPGWKETAALTAAADPVLSAYEASENEHLLAAFDPEKHPHRPGGDSAGGQWAPTASLGGGTLVPDPDQLGAITTSDVNEALRLLYEGKAVNLEQPVQVSMLLDELGAEANAMEKAGVNAPNLNLCNVTLKGSSIFCVGNKGVPRVKMPQLKGDPIPGSIADSLVRDKRGEVDLMPGFIDHLKGEGVAVTPGYFPASYLKATQNELNGVKVAGIYSYLDHGGVIDGPMLVTRDGYVVDGHHRYAAIVGAAARDGSLTNDLPVSVEIVDAPILKVVHEANVYSTAQGIPAATIDQNFGVDPGAQPAARQQLRLREGEPVKGEKNSIVLAGIPFHIGKAV